MTNGRVIATIVYCAIAISLAPLATAYAQPQAYPNQTIRLVTGYPAGVGAVDVLLRNIAVQLKAISGVAVVVENRTGANTNIAAQHVATSKADGYTLFVTAGSSTFGANPHIFRNLPFDPIASFAPVSTLTTLPFVLVVSPTARIASVEELSQILRQKKARGAYATASALTVVMSELYKSIAGLETVQIPYKSAGQSALVELASGEVDFMFVDSANAVAYMKQNRAKLLAVTSGQRSPALPEISTMIEAGVPGYDINSWQAVWAPAGTPRAILERLSVWFNQTLTTEDVKKVMAFTSQDPFPGTPDSLAKLQAAEYEKWGRLVKIARINPE